MESKVKFLLQSVVKDLNLMICPSHDMVFLLNPLNNGGWLFRSLVFQRVQIQGWNCYTKTFEQQLAMKEAMKQVLFKHTLKIRHHLLLWWFCFPLTQCFVKIAFILSCEGISILSFLLMWSSKHSHPCYSFGEIWNLTMWCIGRT